jgi:hypothetical protein
MATFEPRRRGREETVHTVQTRPLKDVQSAVKRFTESAIPDDVRRLEEHQNVMTEVRGWQFRTQAKLFVSLPVCVFYEDKSSLCL